MNKLTPAQRRALLSEWNGGITFGPGEPNRAATGRALLKMGYIEHSFSVTENTYVHGYYTITDAGRAALAGSTER